MHKKDEFRKVSLELKDQEMQQKMEKLHVELRKPLEAQEQRMSELKQMMLKEHADYQNHINTLNSKISTMKQDLSDKDRLIDKLMQDQEYSSKLEELNQHFEQFKISA